MLKKTLLITAVILAVVVISGCGTKNSENEIDNGETVKTADKIESNVSGPCKEEKVEIPNYGDKGKRLKNCFVEYPGEPSRQDKSYYIVEDICGQFTKEFMENMLGEKILKIEPSKYAGLNNCSYYLNEKEYLLLNLEYLKIENQKNFYEKRGDMAEKRPEIPMENLVVNQGGVISDIYFVLNSEKFISLRPNSKSVISDEKFIDLASKIGKAIKSYK